MPKTETRDLVWTRYEGELTIGAYRMGSWVEDGKPLTEWLAHKLEIPWEEERTGEVTIEITWWGEEK